MAGGGGGVVGRAGEAPDCPVADCCGNRRPFSPTSTFPTSRRLRLEHAPHPTTLAHTLHPPSPPHTHPTPCAQADLVRCAAALEGSMLRKCRGDPGSERVRRSGDLQVRLCDFLCVCACTRKVCTCACVCGRKGRMLDWVMILMFLMNYLQTSTGVRSGFTTVQSTPITRVSIPNVRRRPPRPPPLYLATTSLRKLNACNPPRTHTHRP